MDGLVFISLSALWLFLIWGLSDLAAVKILSLGSWPLYWLVTLSAGLLPLPLALILLGLGWHPTPPLIILEPLTSVHTDLSALNYSHTPWLLLLFICLYAGGALSQLYLLFRSYRRLNRLRSESRLHRDQGYILHLHTARIPPCSFGWQTPVILIPKILLQDISPEGRKAVYAHEASHIRAKDPQIMIVLLIIKALLWPHPAIWSFVRKWQNAIEVRADNQALKGASQNLRRHYGQILLTQMRKYKGGTLPCPSATLNLSNLRSAKMRVKNIMNPNPQRDKTRVQEFHLAGVAIVGTFSAALAISSMAGSPQMPVKPLQPLVREPPIFPAHCVPNGGASSAEIVLQHSITPDGHVKNIKVIKSDNACFNGAAIASLKKWAYPPLKKGASRAARKNVDVMIKFVTDEQWKNKKTQ